MFDLQVARIHIQALCLEHNIYVSELPHLKFYQAKMRYSHLTRSREIVIKTITGPLSYVAALHEVGHCVLQHFRHGDNDATLHEEYEAWEWAFTQALWLDGLAYRARHWGLQTYHRNRFASDRHMALALNLHRSGQ